MADSELHSFGFLFRSLKADDDYAMTSKPPATNPKQAALVKLVASFFSSIVRLSSQLTDSDMNVLVINESAKLLPYVTTNRRSIKAYLKVRASQV